MEVDFLKIAYLLPEFNNNFFNLIPEKTKISPKDEVLSRINALWKQ